MFFKKIIYVFSTINIYSVKLYLSSFPNFSEFAEINELPSNLNELPEFLIKKGFKQFKNCYFEVNNCDKYENKGGIKEKKSIKNYDSTYDLIYLNIYKDIMFKFEDSETNIKILYGIYGPENNITPANKLSSYFKDYKYNSKKFIGINNKIWLLEDELQEEYKSLLENNETKDLKIITDNGKYYKFRIYNNYEIDDKYKHFKEFFKSILYQKDAVDKVEKCKDIKERFNMLLGKDGPQLKDNEKIIIKFNKDGDELELKDEDNIDFKESYILTLPSRFYGIVPIDFEPEEFCTIKNKTKLVNQSVDVKNYKADIIKLLGNITDEIYSKLKISQEEDGSFKVIITRGCKDLIDETPTILIKLENKYKDIDLKDEYKDGFRVKYEENDTLENIEKKIKDKEYKFEKLLENINEDSFLINNTKKKDFKKTILSKDDVITLVISEYNPGFHKEKEKDKDKNDKDKKTSEENINNKEGDTIHKTKKKCGSTYKENKL